MRRAVRLPVPARSLAPVLRGRPRCSCCVAGTFAGGGRRRFRRSRRFPRRAWPFAAVAGRPRVRRDRRLARPAARAGPSTAPTSRRAWSRRCCWSSTCTRSIAPPTRPSARILGRMITRSDNDARDDDLRARRRRRPDGARASRPDALVLGLLHLDPRADHRGRPGALLPPHRPLRAAGQPRIRARAARLGDPLPALGLRPARPAAPGFTMEMKAGWRPTANGRLLHAVGRVRARRHAHLARDPHRRQPDARVRDGDRGGVAERVFARGGRGGRRRVGPTPRRRAPAPRRVPRRHPPRSPPASRSTSATRPRTTSPATPLPGYCKPRALMLEPAARALARVQRRLRRRGLGLKVFDAYRPVRATHALVRWAEAVRPAGAGRHLHRAAQPPQRRPGGRPDARARRAPARDGHRL